MLRCVDAFNKYAYAEEATFLTIKKLKFNNRTDIVFHDCPVKHFEKEEWLHVELP